MRTVQTTLLALFAAALLGACGLRGPLYLPDEEPAQNPPSQQPPAADEEPSTGRESKQNTETRPAGQG